MAKSCFYPQITQIFTDYFCFGSLWIPDPFGVRRQSGAAASNLSDGGYQWRLPETWNSGSTRAAAMALS